MEYLEKMKELIQPGRGKGNTTRQVEYATKEYIEKGYTVGMDHFYIDNPDRKGSDNLVFMGMIKASLKKLGHKPDFQMEIGNWIILAASRSKFHEARKLTYEYQRQLK